ncbi:MAG: endonuclease V [Staphylothermus sp.]|nr:endonuclease V [Staphylothermus sp.]
MSTNKVFFDYRRAIKLQKILASKALSETRNAPWIRDEDINYVVGVDAAYSKDVMYGVAVLVDYPHGNLLKYSVVEKKPPIPYVPGLLMFREAPAYIFAIKKLGVKPDIVVVDGHGLSHPRALGIATHIGLVLGVPSIGVAKKKLFGEIIVENNEEYLVAHGLKVARIITHRNSTLYISIGYKIRLEDAYRITKNYLRPQYKLPIPTAIADQLSKKIAHRKKNKL